MITPTAVLARGWLYAQEGKIRLMGGAAVPRIPADETVDANGLTLLPGFIDVHVHGGVGREVMDASPDGLRALAEFYAQWGVTSFLATTWTESRERIMAALEVVAELQGPQPRGATILGAHLEGPYLNVEKSGAQNKGHFRTADRDEALAYLDLNVIRLLSVAPEFEENHWLIEECVRRGVAVSAAHTSATYDQVRQAVAMGLTHATHTYNAMSGLTHREPGTVGAALTSPEIYCELIADNIHVHPAAMHLMYMATGPERVILVTDAVRGAGLPEGEHRLDERTVSIRDGAVRLPDGTLAGSTLTMDRALHNFMHATGQPLETIWKASSLNAARSIHISDHKGSLEVGKDADFVLVDDRITVYLTVAEGRVVYRRGV